MNTYSKYCPNVFLAKCEEQHQKGDTVTLTTRHGKENEVVIYNLIYQKDGFFFYSFVRADGFDHKAWAERRAEKLLSSAQRAENRSNQAFEASNEGKEFLSLGEPIKVGHHSEKRHRALIERNWARIEKALEAQKKQEEYEYRAEYWKDKALEMNLSMPESIEFYEFKLEEAQREHEGMKNGTIPRKHSYSLAYAKKAVNEAQKNFELAKKLWA